MDGGRYTMLTLMKNLEWPYGEQRKVNFRAKNITKDKKVYS